MATQIGRSLDELVRDYMLEEERDSLHKYPYYLKYAIKGLRELTFDVSGAPKRLQLDVDTSTNTVRLPSDFIKEINVGVIVQGQYIMLGRNDNVIKKITDCGNVATNQNNTFETVTETAGSYGIANTWHQHYRNGEVIGAYYGVGGQQSLGQFYINYEEGRIEFSTITSQAEIVLEYISDISSVDGDFRVHPYLEEPILNYIDWVSKRRKLKQYGMGTINALQAKYVDSKIWAAVRIGASSKEEIKATTKKNFTLAPKGL